MTPILPPAANTIWFGAASKDHRTELDNFVSAAGQTPALFQYYNSWADGNGQLPFDTAKADYVHNVLSMAPIVTWEPWDTSIDGVEQLPYQLSTIGNGGCDQYIDDWATAVQTWGHPLFLRFAHEMNGNWYPWGTAPTVDTGLAPNGNTPQHYVEAWRHVHDRFATLGVTNVTWLWAPNVRYAGSTRLLDLYPGDAYVDWIGVDGYNFGNTPDHTWEAFDEVFEATLRRLESIGKPLMITETACEEDTLDPFAKAAWIDDFFVKLNRGKTLIRGFVWFNIGPPEKTHNWPIQSSTQATTAFFTNIAALASAGALAPAPLVP